MTTIELEKELLDLGITTEMVNACGLTPCVEATLLVDAGLDMFDRPQSMTHETRDAWISMKQAALKEHITLKLVSAYRSIPYQGELIRKKLQNGQAIKDILSVSAIPGFSEHHTGCALDLHAGDAEPLNEVFEEHVAFEWLCEHAKDFNFYLSYPRGNLAGIAYEPWHWYHRT